MINASALQKVKLKATTEVAKKDRSDPIFMINAVEESEEEEEKRRVTTFFYWTRSLVQVTTRCNNPLQVLEHLSRRSEGYRFLLEK